MKLLVFGLDGMDQRIAELYDMPYLRSLLKEKVVLNVEEDLWSRGWVKMLSGLPATTTGAFYEKPSLNGTPRFDQGYGTASYPREKSILPIWDELDRKGLRSGFFNLPTTMPAPKVEGFVVAGAGGGFSPNSRIPLVGCHPPEIRDELIERRVIWENRYEVSGIRHSDLYVERCIDAVWRRADTYCHLVKNRGPLDFGFIAHKEPTLLVNIFMRAIQLALEGKPKRTPISFLLSRFFEELDDSMRSMAERLSPEHVMVVSDHGAAPYRRSMNFNVILEDLGFLTHLDPMPSIPGVAAKVKRRIIHEIRSMTDTHPAPAFSRARRIDHRGSKAFSNFYVPGVFINDVRFGGPVLSEKESTELEEAIRNAFNSHPVAKEHRLTARSYRRQFRGSDAYDLLPDLWIDHPEDYFPEQQGLAVQENPFYKDWSDMTGLPRDIGGGKKSKKAMCVVGREFLGNLDPQGVYDLTVVHRLILNHFR